MGYIAGRFSFALFLKSSSSALLIHRTQQFMTKVSIADLRSGDHILEYVKGKIYVNVLRKRMASAGMLQNMINNTLEVRNKQATWHKKCWEELLRKKSKTTQSKLCCVSFNAILKCASRLHKHFTCLREIAAKYKKNDKKDPDKGLYLYSEVDCSNTKSTRQEASKKIVCNCPMLSFYSTRTLVSPANLKILVRATVPNQR